MALSVSLQRASSRLPSPGDLLLIVLNLLGVVAYLHPFISAGVTGSDSRWFEHNTDASRA